MTSLNAAWPLLAFVLVLLAIPLALWAMKRAGLGGSGPGHLLRNVTSLSLSPTQKVMVVEMALGSDTRWMVLGVGQTHITPLMILQAPAGVPAALTSPQGPMVAELLEKFRQGSPGGSGGSAA
jgi:flagellar biogenesis protein FliO